jgi:hypothetical protein
MGWKNVLAVGFGPRVALVPKRDLPSGQSVREARAFHSMEEMFPYYGNFLIPAYAATKLTEGIKKDRLG